LPVINQAFNQIAKKAIQSAAEEENAIMKQCEENLGDAYPSYSFLDEASTYRGLLNDTSSYLSHRGEKNSLEFKRETGLCDLKDHFIKPSYSEDDNVANNIYEHYTKEGGEIKLFNYEDIINRKNETREYVSEVHMDLKIYGSKFIKILIIDYLYQINDEESEKVSIQVKKSEENIMDKGQANSSVGSFRQADKQAFVDGSFRLGTDDLEIHVPDERDLTITSGNFDEKKEHVFPHLDISFDNIFTDRIQVPQVEKEVPNISLNGITFTLQDFEATTHRYPLVPTKIVIEKKRDSTTDKRDVKTKTETPEMEKIHIIHRRGKTNANVSSSVGGSGSHQKKLEYGLNDAIDVKVYPRFYYVFGAIIYVTLIVTTALGWTLRIRSSQTITDYAENVDTVYFANNRLQSLLYLNRWLRFLYLNVTDGVDWSGIENRWPGSLDSIVSTVREMSLKLSEQNKKLQDSIPSSRFDKESFFIKNTKVYEVDENKVLGASTTHDSFHAIMRIVEKTLLIIDNIELQTALLSEFHFALYNSMNDVIVVSINDVSKVINSADEIRNSNFSQQSRFVACIGALLGINLLAIIWLIWTKYNHEKQIYSFLLGVNEHTVALMEQNLKAFGEVLNKENFVFSSIFFEQNYTDNHKHSSERTYTKNPEFKSYLTLTIVKCIPLLILIILFVIDATNEYGTTHGNVNTLDESFRLVRTTTTIQFYIDLCTAAIVEAISQNGSSIIRNEPILEQLVLINTQTPYLLLDLTSPEAVDLDMTYYNAIVYSDPCVILNPSDPQDENAIDMCGREARDVKDSGMIAILHKFVNTGKNLLDKYRASSKTLEELRTLTLEAVLQVVPLDEVLRSLLTKLSDFVRDQFLDIKDEQLRSKRIYNAWFLTMDIIMLLLIYHAGLRHIVEGENRFKRILKLMPKQVLLENKVLRNYLVRNSKDTLNAYRHFM